MIKIRKSHERGHTNLGWLDSYHTFSFGDYYDPKHMGFRSLRVINEDWVKPSAGFGAHPHRDMEIITYVLEGALQHKDSMGNGSTITPGEIQRMSAGTGVTHSEYNRSRTEPVHLLQIWILPTKKNIEPSYEQREFNPGEKQGKLRLVATSDGRDSTVTVHQDVNLLASLLAPGENITYSLKPDRHAWVQIANGSVIMNGHELKHGDGASVSEEVNLEISASESSEILLFDLA
ncbi:MAG: pirin family protein [Candidatus Dadabacteria bacterium]|nr:pirin family protein [Candidatus Dadabacteria bacterium]